jgi:type I restriction enzyme R subunit
MQFNYRRFFKAEARDKLSIILQAEEHILGLAEGKARFIKEVTLLSQAFALSIPHEEAVAIKDEVAFFQAVKARLIKFEPKAGGRSDAQIESAIKQIVDQALSSDAVVDIFDAAGIAKPEISGLAVLSDSDHYINLLSEFENLSEHPLTAEVLFHYLLVPQLFY